MIRVSYLVKTIIARTCHGGQVDRLCLSLLCIQRFRLSPLMTLNQARVYNRCSELISALSPRLCPRCVTGDLSPWPRRHLQASAHQPLTAPLAHSPQVVTRHSAHQLAFRFPTVYYIGIVAVLTSFVLLVTVKKGLFMYAAPVGNYL